MYFYYLYPLPHRCVSRKAIFEAKSDCSGRVGKWSAEMKIWLNKAALGTSAWYEDPYLISAEFYPCLWRPNHLLVLLNAVKMPPETLVVGHGRWLLPLQQRKARECE